MKLPSIKDLAVTDKRVLLRTDYDVPLSPDGRVADETRIEESLPTINYLLSQKAKIIIASHLGRPGGVRKEKLSLRPVFEVLTRLLRDRDVKMSYFPETQEIWGREKDLWKQNQLVVLENLRFDPGEEANDSDFAQKLASLANVYINDAFAASHRQHASIVGVPQSLPSAFGLDCLQEIKVLSEIREKPKRPVVVILGGVKKSKLELVNSLLEWADLILIGGKLADYPEVKKLKDHRRALAVLTKSGEDITPESVQKFIDRIKQAGTVVWTGPLGKFEDPRFESGTKIFAKAMVHGQPFTVVGGGDTEAALTKFKLEDKVDYISSGGGAMLAFLAEGTLPGIEAIIKSFKKTPKFRG